MCIRDSVDVEYDDHIENGRYTYVPEDDNKDNAYVEFNLSDYDKKDSELIYYLSLIHISPGSLSKRPRNPPRNPPPGVWSQWASP